jgi:hypothetical protein
MRKLMLLAAMLALAVLVAAPVLAQNFDFNDNNDNNDFNDNNDNNGFFSGNNDNNNDGFFNNNNGGGGVSQEFEQETDETGDVTLDTSIVNTGNNSNQCVAPLQFGNTGNLQNEQGFLQYNSIADDVEFEGSSFEFAPEQAVDCTQSVEQAAAANG